MEKWNRQIDASDWPALVESLLVDHYDPTYANSQAKNSVDCVSRRTVEVESLDPFFVRNTVVPRLLKESELVKRDSPQEKKNEKKNNKKMILFFVILAVVDRLCFQFDLY